MNRICTFSIFAILNLLILAPSFASVIYAEELSSKEVEVGTLLTWTTMQEINSNLFLVQRADDGMNFYTIGSINAMGRTSVPKAYKYLDTRLTDEKVLYRLLQIDLNGKGSISKTIVVNRKNPNNFMVTDMSNTSIIKFFRVTVQSRIATKLEYQVKDLQNEVLRNAYVNIDEGRNTFEVYFGDLPKANYKLVIHNNEESEELLLRKVSDKDQIVAGLALE